MAAPTWDLRYWPGGRRTVQHRLRDKVFYDPVMGCWNWIGALRAGYGAIKIDGKVIGVHRVVYELKVGPIPASYDLDHLCCNPRCCNPAHLEPVTRASNRRRGLERAQGSPLSPADTPAGR